MIDVEQRGLSHLRLVEQQHAAAALTHKRGLECHVVLDESGHRQRAADCRRAEKRHVSVHAAHLVDGGRTVGVELPFDETASQKYGAHAAVAFDEQCDDGERVGDQCDGIAQLGAVHNGLRQHAANAAVLDGYRTAWGYELGRAVGQMRFDLRVDGPPELERHAGSRGGGAEGHAAVCLDHLIAQFRGLQIGANGLVGHAEFLRQLRDGAERCGGEQLHDTLAAHFFFPKNRWSSHASAFLGGVCCPMPEYW